MNNMPEVNNSMDAITNSFKCQICYEIVNIQCKFNLYCCKAIMCNDCMECLNDCRCPFCRVIIESIKNDDKFYSASAPVRSSFNVVLFSTNEPTYVQLIRERRRMQIDINKKYKRSHSTSPTKYKSHHEKNRANYSQQMKEEIEEYYEYENDVELE